MGKTSDLANSNGKAIGGGTEASFFVPLLLEAS